MIPDPETLVDLYRDMWLIRAFELALEREFKHGNVPGMLHTGVGQEATQAAIAAQPAGHRLLLPRPPLSRPDRPGRGSTPAGERIMAELFGRATGVCSGKGGSLHSADASVGNFGNNAVEGSMMVTALGAALGWKLRKEPNGRLLHRRRRHVGTRRVAREHEPGRAPGRLPVLYCCVNNGYAISTPVGSATPPATSCEFARRLPHPRVQVDGNDIEAAYGRRREAVAYIRAGKGPYFVEYKTWRWQGSVQRRVPPGRGGELLPRGARPDHAGAAAMIAEAMALTDARAGPESRPRSTRRSRAGSPLPCRAPAGPGEGYGQRLRRLGGCVPNERP